jgi:hypothetical protein
MPCLRNPSVSSIPGAYPDRAAASKSPFKNSTPHAAAGQLLLATSHSSPNPSVRC